MYLNRVNDPLQELDVGIRLTKTSTYKDGVIGCAGEFDGDRASADPSNFMTQLSSRPPCAENCFWASATAAESFYAVMPFGTFGAV
jgi:hypothetical protein